MSIIFGIFDKTGQGFDKSWIETMKMDLSHGNPDRTAIWQNPQAAFGNLAIFNTPESLHEILPFKDSGSGLVITSDARIDNRNQIAGKLKIDAAILKNLPDSQLILRAYQKWGIDCVSNLRGDFSFAIFDESKHRLFIARDHFGMKPLFYFDHTDFFVFSSELRGILTLPFFEKRLNEDWFLDFLINTTRKEFDTFYEGIFAVPSGHHLIIEHGKVTLQKYWELAVPERLNYKNNQEYVEGYKELFDASVKNRIRSAYPVGAELSGGLDSSSIVAVAQKFLGTKNNGLHVFSRVLPKIKNPNLDDDDDESTEIKLVCDFCGITNIHWVTMENQKITENIRQIIQVNQAPFMSNYAAYNLNAHHYAKTSGVRTILSGHGGDQMLSNPADFVYNDYVSQHRYFKLYSDIRAKGTIHELEMLKSLKYFLSMFVKRKRSSNKSNEPKKFYKYGIDESFARKHQLIEKYLQNRKTELFAIKNRDDLILKITKKHMIDRIEITNLMAAQENIEFRYPLFDVDLITFYLAVPDEMKYKFRQGRYLHRAALQGSLPPAIQWRKDKHGTINPGLARIFANDSTAIKTSFEHFIGDNMMQSIPIFDLKKIEKLIAEPDENLFDYKSVINKFFQLKSFEKKFEKKFG
jgi:asparagine synthase (glutamine-hydrolysing)